MRDRAGPRAALIVVATLACVAVVAAAARAHDDHLRASVSLVRHLVDRELPVRQTLVEALAAVERHADPVTSGGEGDAPAPAPSSLLERVRALLVPQSLISIASSAWAAPSSERTVRELVADALAVGAGGRPLRGVALVLLGQWRLLTDTDALPLRDLEGVDLRALSLGTSAMGAHAPPLSLASTDGALRVVARGVRLLHGELLAAQRGAELRIDGLREAAHVRARERARNEAAAEARLVAAGDAEKVAAAVAAAKDPLAPVYDAVTEWADGVAARAGAARRAQEPELLMPLGDLASFLGRRFDLASLSLGDDAALLALVQGQLARAASLDVQLPGIDATESAPVPVAVAVAEEAPEAQSSVDDRLLSVKAPSPFEWQHDPLGRPFILINNGGNVWQPDPELYVAGAYRPPELEQPDEGTDRGMGGDIYLHEGLLRRADLGDGDVDAGSDGGDDGDVFEAAGPAVARLQSAAYEDGLTLLSLLHLARIVVRNDSDEGANASTAAAGAAAAPAATFAWPQWRALVPAFLSAASSKGSPTTDLGRCVLRVRRRALLFPPSLGADEGGGDEDEDEDEEEEGGGSGFITDFRAAGRLDVRGCDQLARAAPLFSSDKAALDALVSMARRGVLHAQMAVGARLMDQFRSDLAAMGETPEEEDDEEDEENASELGQEHVLEATVAAAASVEGTGEGAEQQPAASAPSVPDDAGAGAAADAQAAAETVLVAVAADGSLEPPVPEAVPAPPPPRTSRPPRASRPPRIDDARDNHPACRAALSYLLPLAMLAAGDPDAVARAPAMLTPLWEMHEDGTAAGVAAAEPLNVHFVQAQADAGDPDAAMQMGDLLAHGHQAAGLRQDPGRGFDYMTAAAAAGNAHAATQRAIMMLDTLDEDDPRRNLTFAVEQLEAAADAGDVEALAALGFVYQMGRGVAQNLTRAAGYLRRAADLGMLQAHSNLAALYLMGDPNDPTLANASGARVHLELALQSFAYESGGGDEDGGEDGAVFAPAEFNLGLLEQHGWDRADQRGNCRKAANHFERVARAAPWIEQAPFSASAAFAHASRGSTAQSHQDTAALHYLLLGLLGERAARDNAGFLVERGVLARNLDVAGALADAAGGDVDASLVSSEDGGTLLFAFHTAEPEDSAHTLGTTPAARRAAHGLVARRRLGLGRQALSLIGEAAVNAEGFFDENGEWVSYDENDVEPTGELAVLPRVFGALPLLEFVHEDDADDASEFDDSPPGSPAFDPVGESGESSESGKGEDDFDEVVVDARLVAYRLFHEAGANGHARYRLGMCMAEGWAGVPQCRATVVAPGPEAEPEVEWHVEGGAEGPAPRPAPPTPAPRLNASALAHLWLEEAGVTYAHAKYVLATAASSGQLGVHSVPRNLSLAWALLEQCLVLDPLASFPVAATKAAALYSWLLREAREALFGLSDLSPQRSSLWAGLWDCLETWPSSAADIPSSKSEEDGELQLSMRAATHSLDTNADGVLDLDDLAEAVAAAEYAKAQAEGPRFRIGPFTGSASDRRVCSVLVRTTVVAGALAGLLALAACCAVCRSDFLYAAVEAAPQEAAPVVDARTDGDVGAARVVEEIGQGEEAAQVEAREELDEARGVLAAEVME